MIKMTLTEDKRFIVLTSLKNISFSILKEFTNYTDKTGLSNGNSVFIYEIPVYTTNCFVFKYLLLKFTDKFECDDLLKQAIFSEADKVQNPTASILGTEYIGIKCPQIDSYNRLMGMLGGTLAMMNLWKIRFSRLYSSIRVILNWKHIFLPSIQIDDKLKELVYHQLRPYNDFNALTDISLSELHTIHYGWKIKEEGFAKLNYNKASDILFKRPRKYLDRKNIKNWKNIFFGESCFIVGNIIEISNNQKKTFLTLLEHYSQQKIFITFYGSYLGQKYKVNDKIVIKCTKYNKDNANGEEIYSVDEVQTMPILPIYKQSKTNNITTQVLSQCVEELFIRFDGSKLAIYIKGTNKNLWELLQELHFPKDISNYLTTIDELAYIELVFLQLMLISKRKEKDKIQAKGLPKISKQTNYCNETVQKMSFKLTKGQENAVKYFITKMKSNNAEEMLLSADVGAGKTLTAQLALLYNVDCGYQGVFVAPTEILAKQLYTTFLRLIEPLQNKPVIDYLAGSPTKTDKTRVEKGIKNGQINILVGTHAVLNLTDFYNLGLIVLDEQQKFGTEQREKLLKVRKDDCIPDLISQTATPIPRTTALAFYGDVDIVTIEEKPSNRLDIITKYIENTNSESFLSFDLTPDWNNILNELKQGRQMFIVAPAVEEDSKIIAVNKIAKMISRFKEIKSIEISGKMSKKEQNKVLNDFKDGKYNTLIASSVVEVGIDIPNATVMIIVGADYFGISSLHQIRGRVGRGDLQSYCYLLSDTNSENGQTRLKALEQTNNGFELALTDLSTRKQGDVLGVKQSGDSRLVFCDLADHSKLIEKAKYEAEQIFNSEYKNIALEDAKHFFNENQE